VRLTFDRLVRPCYPVATDITSLIQSLETGKPRDSSLSSLSAFSGSFQQTQSVSDSTVALYA
jgi:hypothetical protein